MSEHAALQRIASATPRLGRGADGQQIGDAAVRLEALQRAAGNRAVTGALRGLPRLPVQRAGGAPTADFLGPGWTPVAAVGMVYKDEGANLRERPLPGEQSAVMERLPQNTRVTIVRANAAERWYAVRVLGGERSGAFGYVAQSHVRDDLPDLTSVMYRVPAGQTLGGLVQSHPQYAGYDIRTGDDARSLAMAVYTANQGRGVRLNAERFEEQDSWFEGVLDSFDEYRAKMRQLYQSVELVGDALIWLPGPAYIDRLKASGIIPTRPDWKNEAIEAGKTIGGFVAGLSAGFLGAFQEAVEGLYDLGKSVIDLIVDIVTGEALETAADVYDYLDNLSEEDVKALARAVVAALISGVAGSIDDFLDKWTTKNVYHQWHFRGRVVGTVLAEVVMALITGGAAAAALLGKLGPLGLKLQRVVQKVATKIDKIVPGRKRGADADGADADVGQRGIAAAKARLIAEAADQADLPLPAVLAALRPLTRHKGVGGFGAEPVSPGHYRIVMRTVIDEDYTPGGGAVPGRGSERYDRLLAVVRMARSERSFATRGNYSLRLNETLGRVNRAEADFVGERFVGDGFHVTDDGMYVGRRFTDGDKLCRRVYRPPTAKPGNPRSATGVQANYVTERQVVDVGYRKGQRTETTRWEVVSNGHLDVGEP